MRGKSGAGWDDSLGLVTGSEEFWKQLSKVRDTFFSLHPLTATLKINPSLVVWRTKPFTVYDEMACLVNGIIATGSMSFRAGQGQPSLTSPTNRNL